MPNESRYTYTCLGSHVVCPLVFVFRTPTVQHLCCTLLRTAHRLKHLLRSRSFRTAGEHMHKFGNTKICCIYKITSTSSYQNQIASSRLQSVVPCRVV